MKTSSTLKLAFSCLAMTLVFAQNTTAQTFQLDKSSTSVVVEGTSNIHDWQVKAESFTGSLTGTLEGGKLNSLDKLTFVIPAESLKSGKSGMDKNTYKALDTKKHPNITYNLDKVKQLDCSVAGQCQITSIGFLTIAGTRQPVEIIFNAKISADKIILTGSKKLKMTQFKVDPPKAMLGTITTGDEITIKFETAFIH